MSHKIASEKRDGLLCVWFTQSSVAREENPQKQPGMAWKCTLCTTGRDGVSTLPFWRVRL